MSTTFLDIIKQLPNGASLVFYNDIKYLLTKEGLFDGKIYKIYARSLSHKDIISFNYYITKNGENLKPCEMSQKKVLDFILGMKLVV